MAMPTLCASSIEEVTPAVNSAVLVNGIKSNGVNKTTEKESKDIPPTPLPFYKTSYPSRCLDFLKGIKGPAATPSSTATPDTAQAELSLQIHVVGAGIGGLATAVALARRGHLVTVFEQAPALGEVGAGIQIPPNSGKLLDKWGVTAEMGNQAVQPEGINFRRWECGERIGFTDLSSPFAETCGAPYYVAHRSHLHSALLRAAQKLGVEIRLNSRVVHHDPEIPAITIEGGQTFDADLVIAADGIKSIGRSYVSQGSRSKPRPTSYAAYRATVDVERMKEIPEASELIEKPGLNIWIGEDRHVMTYTITAGKSFNMVLSHKDIRDPTEWSEMTQSEIISEMMDQFRGWDSRIVKIMGLIESVLKWPLIGNNSLDSWVSSSARLVVLGDAAHAMVPYMSQGAAMAVEDGAALAVALNNIRSTRELKFALRTFEKERKARTSMMQEASMVNAMIWHFPDGPEQRARDSAMRAEVEGRSFQASPNQWSDPVTQSWAYGYDAEDAMQACWNMAVQKLIENAEV